MQSYYSSSSYYSNSSYYPQINYVTISGPTTLAYNDSARFDVSYYSTGCTVNNISWYLPNSSVAITSKSGNSVVIANKSCSNTPVTATISVAVTTTSRLSKSAVKTITLEPKQKTLAEQVYENVENILNKAKSDVLTELKKLK